MKIYSYIDKGNNKIHVYEVHFWIPWVCFSTKILIKRLFKKYELIPLKECLNLYKRELVKRYKKDYDVFSLFHWKCLLSGGTLSPLNKFPKYICHYSYNI